MNAVLVRLFRINADNERRARLVFEWMTVRRRLNHLIM